MNRLLLSSGLAHDFLAGDDDRPSRGSPEDVSPPTVPHKLFTPLHYEKNYAYPLLVWLHSGESTERQLLKIMPFVSLRNYVAIAPRGTSTRANGTGEESVWCWDQTLDGISSAEAAVTTAVEIARKRCHIATDRVFVAGYADGGTMAMRLTLRRPEYFAGGISLHGPLPRGHRPLGQCHAGRRPPVLIISGRNSLEYPEQEVCRDIRLLHAAGISVEARQYDVPEDVTSRMLADVDRWLMAAVTATPATPRVESPPKYLTRGISLN